MRSLRWRFALIKWERQEAWVVVKVRVSLAVLILKAVRPLHRGGLVSERGLQRAIALSAGLDRKAHATWAAFAVKRDLLRAEARKHLARQENRKRGGQR